MIPKFRAWIKEEKKMLEPDDILNISFKRCELVPNFNFEFEKEEYDLFDLELMQSTGIEDKNGKEIFEGDIVTDGDVTSDIKYHQTLGFYMIGKYGFSVPFGQGVDVEYFEEFADHVSKTFEVVGNIYENPELLEVTE